MSKNNIVIAGGGFAGISALKYLSAHKSLIDKDFKVVLIDKKDYSEFLPMLPDVIGGWLNPDILRFDLNLLSKELGCEFIKGDIKNINLEEKKIDVLNQNIYYRYAIISSGSETNFYGNKTFAGLFYKLDNVENAIKIKNDLLKKARLAPKINVIIVGGGYTGVEIATNVKLLLTKQKIPHKIYVIERAPDILAVVPDWMREEVKQELKALKIECLSQQAVKDYDGETLILESGRAIKDAFCIWAAGVKTADFLKQPGLLSERTRIKVDGSLRPINGTAKDIFLAGDSALFTDKKTEKPLRMAVMFSIAQGKVAAKNVLNSIFKRPLDEYKPVDLGYLVPMARGKAPGIILGWRIHGLLGYLSHYFMCMYRSERSNKFRLIGQLMKKKFT